jgi:hypothetical protein
MGDLGNDEKIRPWPFSSRKTKNAVFDFLYFLSLFVIENAGPSLVRSGSALNPRSPWHFWAQLGVLCACGPWCRRIRNLDVLWEVAMDLNHSPEQTRLGSVAEALEFGLRSFTIGH